MFHSSVTDLCLTLTSGRAAITAFWLRPARCGCRYSLQRVPPSRCCLKRSSAFSLEVMKISFAFKLRNAVLPDVEFAWVNGLVTRIVPKTRGVVLGRGQAMPASFMPSLV